MNTDKKNDRPESYPKPTEVDTMLKHQEEFSDNLNTEGISHNPHPNSEPPKVKETPDDDTDTPDRLRDLP